MSTPSAHLRAALEKRHAKFLVVLNDDTTAAILEAMEAYRNEALAEVEAWAKTQDWSKDIGIDALIKHLRALKNSSAGNGK